MKSQIFVHPQFKKREKDDFLRTVKERVAAWFEKEGIGIHATQAVRFKARLHLLTYVVLWALIFSNQFSGIPLMILFGLFGMVQGLMGFNISHDALHNAFSSDPKINQCLGYLYDWNGASSLAWRKTHNILHHTFTNVTGHDEDINKSPLLRFSPHDPWHWYNPYQNYYALILYSFVSIPWIFWGDWKWLLDSAKNGHVSKKDWIIFASFKALNFFLLVVLPFLILSVPAWQVILGLLFMHMASGFMMSLVFQLAHLVEGVEFPLPNDEGNIDLDWGSHEMKTTSNFATTDPFMCWIMGGLNFQIEHHLFPHICHIHYPKISQIVRETAKEYNLPYHEQPSFYAAVRSHFRLLKKFGAKPERSFHVVD